MTPPRTESFDVFISYAHADDRGEMIRRLKDALAAARNLAHHLPWTFFFDLAGIRTGDDWERRIGAGLRSARLMVALLSPAYFRSDWCRKEWMRFCEQER